MKIYDTVIIGGGISGVVAAYNLSKKNKNFLLIEKNETLGGLIETVYYKDFWIEMGAHSCFNSYKETLKIIDEIDFKDSIQTRKNLPFLLAYGSEKYFSVLSKINKFKVILSIIKMYLYKKKNSTISEYYRMIFGKKSYDNIFKHAFNAVLSQNSYDFPAELLFKKYDRNKKYPKSFTFKNGLSSFINEIVKNSDIEILKKTTVHKITKSEDNSWIISTNKHDYIAKNIILSTDFFTAKILLQNIMSLKKFPDYNMSNIISVGIIISKNNYKNLKEIGGLIGVSQKFFSVVTRDMVPHKDYRGITVHFKKQLDWFDDDYLNYALKYFKITDSDLKFYKIKSQNVVMLNNSFKKLDVLKLPKGISLTGNFFNRLAIEDCVKKSSNIILEY